MAEGDEDPQGELGSLGRYTLIRRLGRGGMAEVFEGRAEGAAGVRKRVCVKRILPAFAADPRFVRRFVEEARISMALHHGNVAQVFDFGREGRDLFLVMELVDGFSLAEITGLLRHRGERMPEPVALQIVQEVCKALHHAHTLMVGGTRRCIVHRDVSPQNVLVSHEGQVKLVDFGIARAAAASGADPAGVAGKVHYMAPEQAAGGVVDARADVFGAGALLFELLAGRPPIDTDEPAALMALADGRIPALTTVAPDVSERLAAIVDRALSPDPARRHSSALALQEALADYGHRHGRWASEDAVGALVRGLLGEGEATGGGVRRDERRRSRPAARRRAGLVLGIAVPLVAALIAVLAMRSGETWPPPVEFSDRPVTVRSNPPGAAVILNGAETGVVTDGILHVAPGRVHQLTFRMEGYRTESRRLMPGDEVLAVDLEVETRPARRPETARLPPTGPPVVVEASDQGFLASVDPARAAVGWHSARAAWIDLEPGGGRNFDLRITSEVRMTHDGLTGLLVAESEEGRLIWFGRLRTRIVVPRASARLGLVTLRPSSCLGNVGDLVAFVRHEGIDVGEIRADSRIHCISYEDAGVPVIEGLARATRYRVAYEGPDDGPPLLLVGSGDLLMAVSRDRWRTLVRPGRSGVIDHVDRVYVVTLSDSPEALPEERFRLRFTPVSE